MLLKSLEVICPNHGTVPFGTTLASTRLRNRCNSSFTIIFESHPLAPTCERCGLCRVLHDLAQLSFFNLVHVHRYKCGTFNIYLCAIRCTERHNLVGSAHECLIREGVLICDCLCACIIICMCPQSLSA